MLHKNWLNFKEIGVYLQAINITFEVGNTKKHGLIDHALIRVSLLSRNCQ